MVLQAIYVSRTGYIGLVKFFSRKNFNETAGYYQILFQNSIRRVGQPQIHILKPILFQNAHLIVLRSRKKSYVKRVLINSLIKFM